MLSKRAENGLPTIAFRDEVKVATIEHKTLVGKKNSITGQQYMAVAEEIIDKEGQANG